MKIQLSISLLASNRVESLERCLDSLRPLLMQVPSELIIVFTGTDERVREMAGRYTDKILSFTWCNNFSAARNVGLWAAKGEWFMYIDDDEWFEDVTEIRDFFLTGEYQRYGSGFYKQKNYTDWDGIHYSDYHAFRMARIVPGIAFQNTVHEELMPRLDPAKYFNTYVNHYGYVSDTGRLSQEKSSRNIPLLLQNIEERPSFVKNYLQLVQEYLISHDLEKAEEYCRKGRALCKGYEDNYYRSWLQVNLVSILVQKKNYEKAEEEVLLILKKENPWELARLDLFIQLLAIYTEWDASEKILKYGLQFEELLAYMEHNPDLWRRQSYGDLTEGWIKNPPRLDQIRINCTNAALRLKKMKNAAYFLTLFPWDEETRMERYYPHFDNWKKQYDGLFQDLLSGFPEQSPYLLLQKALDPEAQFTKEERQGFFRQCLERTDFSYLRYQAVKEAVLSQVNLSGIVDVLELDIWKEYAANIQKQISPEEAGKLAEAAVQLRQDAPIYGMWLDKLLYEKKLIRGCLTRDALLRTLNDYVQCILSFYRTQYRKEMFQTEKYHVLPKDCRFALLVAEALEKIERSDFAEAVRLLRKAIRFLPSMTGVIREVIRQIKIKADHPVTNTGEEFQMLAQQMKGALREMIDNRQYTQALPVILQLSPLLPEDLELLRMRQTVLQQTAE